MLHIVKIHNSINDSHIMLIRDAIKVLDSNPEARLEIKVDSAGGDPDAAKVIYDLLKDYRSRTATQAGVKCMSCGILVFLAGDIRMARKDTQFMMHPTSWTLWGMFDFLKAYRSLNTGDLTLTLSEVYTVQAQLNKALQRLIEIEDYTDAIYKERASLTKEQLHDRRFINTDKEFTAEESLKFGISTLLI